MPVSFRLLCLVACTCVLRAASSGEVGRPFLQAFSPRDYRAHQQIWMGAQAPDGVMWFGNSHSVLSYDGSAWRRIEVPTSFVRALVLGRDGRVYVGGTDQLGCIASDPTGQHVFVSLLDHLPPDRRQLGVIWSAAATTDAVWFATETTVLRWSSGKFETWTMANKPRQYLQAVGDELFLHRQGVGLFRFDGREFAAVSEAPEFAQSSACFAEPQADGSILLGLSAGKFFELRAGRLTARPTPVDALIARSRPRLMVRLPDGTHVFDTNGLGVIVTDAAFNFLTRVTGASGLGSDVVLSLTPDREGGVWVGSNNGVVRLEPMPRFSAFDQAVGLPRGLIHDLRRHDGTLFAATPAGLFRLVPAGPATAEPAHFAPVPLEPGICWSLASHADGLLIANASGVLQLPAAGPARKIFPVPGGVSKLAVLPRHPDRVFVGRFTGFNVLHRTDGAWRDEGGPAGLSTEVRTIAESADGALWLGTPTRGFLKLTRPPGSEHWSDATVTAYREQRGLPPGQGWSHVYQVGDSVVFVTDAGTFLYDAAADRFVLAAAYQLAGRHARTQLWPLAPTDRADRVWAQADTEDTDLPRQLGALTLRAAGPAEFAPLPRKILERVAFGGARALSWERGADGEVLWLGGPDGLVRADLGRSEPPAAKFDVLLREVALPAGARRVPATEATAPRFDYGPAPLTFTFSATRFGAGPGLRYQTRLRGYDVEWSPWSPRPEATYTHVWGGPFVFEARAQDPDGRVSTTAAFAFSVTPPWQFRPVAIVGYVAALFLAVFGFVRWRLALARRRETELAALVTQRTHDLASARDQAEAASRAKSAFLAAMSHELRTPLNGVIGYAQILQGDRRLAPDQQERLRIVQSSGEHLLRMINDVLDLAKIEAGKIDLRPAPFALVELVRDLAATHAAAAATKGLAFAIDAAPDLPVWVEGDAHKLRQILDNLLGNAVKFTPHGGVTLRVVGGRVPAPAFAAIQPGEPCGHGDVPAHLHFAVTDTGPGIAPEDQARLFQPFEQARVARPAAPGTGLGLAISRALVERMGGTLALASAPGAGSTFSFAIALPPCGPGALAGTARITGYAGPRRHVLIVDDHAVNRRLVVDLLTPLGFTCADYASGGAALAELKAGATPWPDLAIVDVRLGELDGLAVTRALRALPRGTGLRVLLTSASVLTFNLEEGRRAGCDEFLPKPFRAEELLDTLRRLLALEWRETAPDPLPAAERAAAPLPEALRSTLRDALAQGDLEALRRHLAEARAAQPSLAAALDELDAAAAGFDLARLRQRLAAD
ncbi:MAG: response regulator [Verrucomicrobia bacterium]|nr:response regulator [Verrucomicrobiota bacterium]